MADADIVREWLVKADEDFEFASVILAEGKPFSPQICFHFQQAAEKYLKACTILYDLEFRKTHDLTLILKNLLVCNQGFEKFREDVEFLSVFYIDTRYPVHWPVSYSRDEAQKAREAASRIREFVRKAIAIKEPLSR
jgi:HEPN domain-containing protein